MSTLKKIADIAGCSVSTVSRALNNCHDVSIETKGRIIKIAKEIGYFKRKKHIKLENRRKDEFNVAILCPEIESAYYTRMIIGISNELRLKNCRTIIYNYAFDQVELGRLFEMCHTDSNVDGVICLGSTIDYSYDDGMPVLLYGNNGNHLSFEYDISNGVNEVFSSLKDGEEIYLISEQKTRSQELEFARTSKKYPKIIARKYISAKRFEQAGYEAGEHLIKKSKLPRAAICAYDEIAIGLIEFFHNHNVKVPEDVSVIGINDIPTAKYCFGGLTTIAFDFESIVSDLIDNLVADMKHSSAQKCKFVVSSRLIKRKT